MPEPLKIQDMENMEILDLSAPEGGGWFIMCDSDEEWYGGIPDFFDSPSIYEDGEAMSGPLPVRIFVDVDPDVYPKELVNVPAGYRVRLTFDGGKTKTVYFPHITGDDLVPGGAGWWLPLYVASDGSTYYDEALTQLAYRVPTSYYVEAFVILRQYVELGASASLTLKQWVDLLSSAILRQLSCDELEATCIIRQLPPEIPVGLTALDMKKGDSVLLNWTENAEPNVLYYKIYKRAEEGEWEYAGQAKTSPYQVGGLLKDTKYYFAITAVAVRGGSIRIYDNAGNVVVTNDGKYVVI